jgi:hypothetical protein
MDIKVKEVRTDKKLSPYFRETNGLFYFITIEKDNFTYTVIIEKYTEWEGIEKLKLVEVEKMFSSLFNLKARNEEINKSELFEYLTERCPETRLLFLFN